MSEHTDSAHRSSSAGAVGTALAGERRRSVLGAASALLLLSTGCSSSFSTTRQARVESSPQYQDGEFSNPMPMEDMKMLKIMGAQIGGGAAHRSPDKAEEIPVEHLDASRFATPPESGLRITWLGHSTALIEIDGWRVLTDPVWSKRASPYSWAGPSRFHEPPLSLDDLPDIDVVVLSHDHYDHLDEATIKRLEELASRDGHGPRVGAYAVPLGVGQHLEDFGVAAARILERDWWEEVQVGDLTLTCAPARHYSGRSLTGGDRNHTLWAGWALRGREHAVYFTGDSGLFDGFAEIGDKLGPFDAALVEIGSYNALWRDIHMGPEQAVRAHQMLRAELFFPIHWGTFDLALHSWTEPVERLLVAAGEEHAVVVVLVLATRPPEWRSVRTLRGERREGSSA